MQEQKQKSKDKVEQKDTQIPKAAPVIDNSDLLSQLSEATKEESETDYSAMDDGSSIDDGGGGCSCF